jgi:G3E family GTPase
MSLAYDVIPVTLVTGFLGSGKSTLLADILTGEAARDTAVLVNEFGAVGLDHLLMGEVDTQTVLLDNGCVCCSIRGELKDALATLFSRRARGEVPPFSRVVLETTGLATPAPIIATLLADPVIRSHYVLNAILTVVDAMHAGVQRARHPEWLAQVTAADRILISKVDLAVAEDVEQLRSTLASLNPAAEIVQREIVQHDGSTDSTLATLLFTPASSQGLISRIGAQSVEFGVNSRRLMHRNEVERERIESCCIRIDEPLDWQVFTLWFTMLLNRHGDKILRVKGLLSIAGSERPAVLHAVQHLVHPVLHLDTWPDAIRATQLVFITEALAGEQIEASYRRFCLALAEPESETA